MKSKLLIGRDCNDQGKINQTIIIII
ncbi:hypothetical protein AERO8C_50597 [Aeromonas veronii]|uniref:Uncharacterized protein n=1 Tax=Aeromonas veronii TaxID=654 RepID=A0A653LA41_AERVE|nr:hypothetical protein AERO8C_50597 [Aeromonas veronii]